ncbi:MAG: response regulator [Acidobacteriota bacterium]
MVKRPSKSSNGQSPSDEQRARVLLVDEDASDLDRYSGMLRYFGYEVWSVGSYSRAASSLGRERFDLIIIEQGSADFQGRAVLTRAVEIDRRVPVLVFTRVLDVDCCLEALDIGACEYVQKPLTSTEFRDLVSDYSKAPMRGFSVGQGGLLRHLSSGGGREKADISL